MAQGGYNPMLSPVDARSAQFTRRGIADDSGAMRVSALEAPLAVGAEAYQQARVGYGAGQAIGDMREGLAQDFNIQFGDEGARGRALQDRYGAEAGSVSGVDIASPVDVAAQEAGVQAVKETGLGDLSRRLRIGKEQGTITEAEARSRLSSRLRGVLDEYPDLSNEIRAEVTREFGQDFYATYETQVLNAFRQQDQARAAAQEEAEDWREKEAYDEAKNTLSKFADLGYPVDRTKLLTASTSELVAYADRVAERNGKVERYSQDAGNGDLNLKQRKVARQNLIYTVGTESVRNMYSQLGSQFRNALGLPEDASEAQLKTALQSVDDPEMGAELAYQLDMEIDKTIAYIQDLANGVGDGAYQDEVPEGMEPLSLMTTEEIENYLDGHLAHAKSISQALKDGELSKITDNALSRVVSNDALTLGQQNAAMMMVASIRKLTGGVESPVFDTYIENTVDSAVLAEEGNATPDGRPLPDNQKDQDPNAVVRSPSGREEYLTGLGEVEKLMEREGITAREARQQLNDREKSNLRTTTVDYLPNSVSNLLSDTRSDYAVKQDVSSIRGAIRDMSDERYYGMLEITDGLSPAASQKMATAFRRLTGSGRTKLKADEKNGRMLSVNPDTGLLYLDSSNTQLAPGSENTNPAYVKTFNEVVRAQAAIRAQKEGLSYEEAMSPENLSVQAKEFIKTYRGMSGQSTEELSMKSPSEWTREDTDAAINIVSSMHDIPSATFNQWIKTESSFRRDAVSNKGAIGLGQIKPDTFQHYYPEGDINHPWDNLVASARFIDDLRTKYSSEAGSENQLMAYTFSAYIAGETKFNDVKDGGSLRENEFMRDSLLYGWKIGGEKFNIFPYLTPNQQDEARDILRESISEGNLDPRALKDRYNINLAKIGVTGGK